MGISPKPVKGDEGIINVDEGGTVEVDVDSAAGATEGDVDAVDEVAEGGGGPREGFAFALFRVNINDVDGTAFARVVEGAESAALCK